jgi:hypothetical protein
LVREGSLATWKLLGDSKRSGRELDGALVDIQPFMAEHAPLIGTRGTKVLRCPDNEDGDEDDHEDEDGTTI